MMLDTLGNPIDVGAYVAYPWRASSSMGITIGRVVLIDTKVHTISLDYRGHKRDRAACLERLDRVIVLHPDQVPAKIKEALA